MGQDKRVVRTKRALTQALFTLLGEKEFQRITVTELARRAGVDRKTFYLHYQSVEEILEDFYTEQLVRLQETMEHQLDRPADAAALFRSLNTLMEEDLDAYRGLAKGPAQGFFREKLAEALKGRILLIMGRETAVSRELREFYAEYFTTGILAAYVDWLRGDIDLTGAEMATRLSRVVMDGFNSVRTK